MTLAAGLLNTPHDQGSWDIWAFNLDQNIKDITAAIGVQRNVALPIYQLYPIPAVDMLNWLLRLGIAIGDIAGTLNLQAADVENVNIDDPRERQAWVFQIFQEVQAARSILKI